MSKLWSPKGLGFDGKVDCYSIRASAVVLVEKYTSAGGKFAIRFSLNGTETRTLVYEDEKVRDADYSALISAIEEP